MDLSECYEVSKKIVAELAGAGLAEESAAVLSVLEGGTAGTEILMGLRRHFRKIRKMKSQMPRDLSARISQTIKAMDVILKTGL